MTIETTTTTTARIYVGTYHKYSSGSIKGAWVNMSDCADADDFTAACAQIHADESDPEFMFQDWEGIPAGMISESHLNNDFFEWLALDNDDRAMLAVYRDHIDVSGSIEQARRSYYGTHASAEEGAEFMSDESGDLALVPESLRGHIDWKSVVYDLKCGGTSFVEVNGRCWIFTGAY
jgi:antirestriction protein